MSYSKFHSSENYLFFLPDSVVTEKDLKELTFSYLYSL